MIKPYGSDELNPLNIKVIFSRVFLTSETYREKIWDHAAGKLIVEAAGGTVTDMHGKPLDFSLGRHLDNNKGVVATGGAIHDEVIEAIRQVRAG